MADWMEHPILLMQCLLSTYFLYVLICVTKEANIYEVQYCLRCRKHCLVFFKLCHFFCWVLICDLAPTNWHPLHLVIKISSITLAATKLGTLQPKLVAFTSTWTLNFATTFCKLLAALCNWRQRCPEGLPSVALLSPTPIYKTWQIHLGLEALAPNKTRLEGGTLSVFTKGCTCGRNCVILPLLTSKHIKPYLMDILVFTWPVKHRNHKFFYDLHVMTGYIWRIAA